MGVVYRATQLALERPVALKLIAADRAKDPEFRARFRRESRIAASLHHPNIVSIYEVGECEGQPFFSMRFVEGGALSARNRKSAQLRGGGRVNSGYPSSASHE